MAPFESFQQGGSFVISDLSEAVPDLESDPPALSMTASATFELQRPGMDCEEQEEDTVSLSKSTSFADVMDILKDMKRMKMSKDR